MQSCTASLLLRQQVLLEHTVSVLWTHPRHALRSTRQEGLLFFITSIFMFIIIEERAFVFVQAQSWSHWLVFPNRGKQAYCRGYVEIPSLAIFYFF